MSTAAKDKRVAARDKVAAQRRAARRAQRRARILISGGSVAAVLAIVLSLVLVKALGTSPPARPGPAAGSALSASIASVPPGTLTAVGTGGAAPGTVARIGGAPLTSGGKPEILYVGAEYCPYCATERWPLAVALSRFGTFSGLHGIHSSSTDVYPSQPTLTFYGSVCPDGRRGIDPLHRPGRQVPDPRRPVRPAGPAGPHLGAGRRSAA
jgi:hypothetical protein